MSQIHASISIFCIKVRPDSFVKFKIPNERRYSVDLSYPVRFCNLPLKQWVVQFDNEKF